MRCPTIVLALLLSLAGCSKPAPTNDQRAATAAPVATPSASVKADPPMTADKWREKIGASLGTSLVLAKVEKANVSAEARRSKELDDRRFVVLGEKLDWSVVYDPGTKPTDTFAQEAQVYAAVDDKEDFSPALDALQSTLADTFAMKDIEQLVFVACKKVGDNFSVFLIATVTRAQAEKIGTAKLTAGAASKALGTNVQIIGAGQKIQWDLATSH